MSEYWPADIDLKDTANPLEILEEAAKAWTKATSGTVELLIQTATSKSKYDLLQVHGKHVPSGRTVSLFSVVHRPHDPYPARIQLDDEGLPDFFKKVYYEPGRTAFASAISALSEKTERQKVTSEWVCDVPSEFRSKLRDALNDGAVKTKILNLIAAPKQMQQPKPEVEPLATNRPQDAH